MTTMNKYHDESGQFQPHDEVDEDTRDYGARLADGFSLLDDDEWDEGPPVGGMRVIRPESIESDDWSWVGDDDE